MTRVYSDSNNQLIQRAENLKEEVGPGGAVVRRKHCPRNCVQMYTMNSTKEMKDFETFSDGLRNCTGMEHVFGAFIFRSPRFHD